ARYDVLVLPNGVLPDPSQRAGATSGDEPPAAGGGGSLEYPDSLLPAEDRNERGRVTAEKKLPPIKKFVEDGGTVIAIGGSSSTVAGALGLPVTNHLVENGQPLPRTKFYVPGSILGADVDTSDPLAAGMNAKLDVFYDNSPTFDLSPDAASKG